MDWLIDNTPMQDVLWWWADIWGVIGGALGTATGAAVEDNASDAPTSDTCDDARQALDELDVEIAALRDEIDEAKRMAATWTSIAIYLTGASAFAIVVTVLLGLSAIVSGPGGALPGFGALVALVASASFAFAASVAFGYAASWNERARQLTDQLNELGEDRLDAQDEVDRLCGVGSPVVDEPTFDVVPFK